MECPLAIQRLALSELVFVAEKAKKKKHQCVMTLSTAVVNNNDLLLHMNDNTDPVGVANVDRKKQSLVCEDVDRTCVR